MSSVSVAVMAHRKRSQLVPGLLSRLGVGEDRVVWDRANDRWDTGARAWAHIDRRASHGLVIQDDAVACRDLIAGLESALDHVPINAAVCLYVGRVRPLRDLVQQLVDEADEGTAWLTMSQIHWGVGIVLPTDRIDDMLAWCHPRSDIANYDRRISRWAADRRMPAYYPWPSLVDHREGPSMVPGRGSRGRRAHQFLGIDASALDVDWGGAVTTIPPLFRHHRDIPEDSMPPWHFHCDRYPNVLVPLPGAPAVRFRDGVATVHRREQAETLVRLGGSFGITLADGPAMPTAAPPPPAAEPEPEPGPTPEPAAEAEPAEVDAAPAPPPRNATAETWRDYAVALGFDPDHVATLRRADLIEALADG